MNDDMNDGCNRGCNAGYRRLWLEVQMPRSGMTFPCDRDGASYAAIGGIQHDSLASG